MALRTLNPRRLTRAQRARWLDETGYPPHVERPRTRGDCLDGPRPCPWVSCRHHLAFDLNRVGSVTLTHPEVPIAALRETCSLDVADRGGASLAEIAEHLGLSSSRADHAISEAVSHAREVARSLGAQGFDLRPSLVGAAGRTKA